MKTIIIISSILVSFMILSCDESINPYAEFKEDFILNGIIRGDTTYQIFTLSHSYQPNGPDPLTYKDDPAIAGSQIELYYDNKVYQLRDSSIVRADTSHFTSSFKFYYTENFKPDVNKKIELKAYLPNGQILQSQTQTPNLTSDFFDPNNDFFIPADTGTSSIIRWNASGKYAYAPHLQINYYTNNNTTLKNIAVPLYYQSDNTPVYPEPTRNNFILIDTVTVRKTLDELVKLVTDRSSIKIINLTMDLLIFDEYLSSYYSSIQLGVSGFTIRIDDPDFSNIKGGLGIFGSYVRTKYTLRFSSPYLKSLGFQ